MGYGIRHTGMEDTGYPNFQRHPQSDRKPYEKCDALPFDYLDHIRMSSDGCPNDIPQYILDKKR